MSKAFFRIFIIIFLFSITSESQVLFVKSRVIKSENQFENLLESLVSKSLQNIKIKYVRVLPINDNSFNIFVVKLNKEENLTQLKTLLEKNNNNIFDYVQLSGAYKIEEFPNDEYFSLQWGMHKIDIEGAWQKTTGDSSIVIGLIDTGIDFENDELQGRFFINSGEIGIDANGNDKRFNGIDDDGNGFTDDYRGWNFITSSEFLVGNNNPQDDQGHGTIVAGVIGAKTDNNLGIAGVNPVSKILVAKAFDENGYGKEEDVVSAMLYLANNGANLINMSFGDYTYSQVMHDIVNYVASRGVILIGSAGNSSSPSPHYPSAFEQVISIGASDENDELANFSNYGNSLDLLAPGTNILSLGQNNTFVSASGTSLSAPFVTGVVSLILSLRPNLNYEEVRQILRTTANDVYDEGYDIYSGAGILNAKKAVEAAFNSEISINSPGEDEWFSSENIIISATVLSPFFTSFSVFLGVGNNPQSWEQVYSSQKQVSNDTLFTLNTENLLDTVYTLKLEVLNSDGSKNTVFKHLGVDKTAPFPLMFLGMDGFIENKPTFFSISYTNEFTKALFNFESNSFYLDNGSINIGDNRFMHSGFVPPDILSLNSTYSFDIQYINKAGLSSNLSDFLNNLYFQTQDYNDLLNFPNVASFNLEGEPYEKPVLLNGKKYLLVNDFNDFSSLKFYEIINDTLLATEPEFSLQNHRIPVYAGEINNFNYNRFYLICFQYPQLTIDVFDENSQSFVNLIQDNRFKNLLFAGEILNGFFLISSENNKIYFTELENNLNFTTYEIENTTPVITNSEIGENLIVSQNSIVKNYNSHSEIFLFDNDGDLLRIFATSSGARYNFSLHDYFQTYEFSSKAMLNFGSNNSVNILILGDENFFNSKVWFYTKISAGNSLQDIVNKAIIPSNLENNLSNTILKSFDGNSKNILITGSEQYIFEDATPIYYEKLNNFTKPLRSIYIDENSGYFAIPSENDEFTLKHFGGKPVPHLVKAYSLDSNIVYLEFSNDDDSLSIYKFSSGASSVFNGITGTSFIDSNAILGMNYYLLTYDNENFSDTAKVFAHRSTRLDSVTQISSNTICLNFNNKISRNIDFDGNTAFNLLGVRNNVSSVAFNSEKSYLLTFNFNFPLDTTLRLILNNFVLNDFYGSPLSADTVEFHTRNFNSANTEFFVQSFEINSTKSVQINFNLPFDSTSVSNINNYKVSPFNKIMSIKILSEQSIGVTFENPIGAVGKKYLLTISNVKSSRDYGNILINEGSGSQIMLVTSKDNLADAYVFPNPVNENNSENITFANLTKRYKIMIFNLSGDLVQTISANNSPGAFVWNLTDKNGRKIPSGVYIYYIEKLDENDNILETKTNKFAVVK